MLPLSIPCTSSPGLLPTTCRASRPPWFKVKDATLPPHPNARPASGPTGHRNCRRPDKIIVAEQPHDDIAKIRPVTQAKIIQGHKPPFRSSDMTISAPWLHRRSARIRKCLFIQRKRLLARRSVRNDPVCVYMATSHKKRSSTWRLSTCSNRGQSQIKNFSTLGL